jgi:hypothetical protein
VFENILRTLFNVSYGQLCVYHHAIEKSGYLERCLLSFVYQNAFDATIIMLSLNAYFDKCLEIIATFYDFTIQHVSRNENTVVNDLAQQASGFRSNRENCMF